MRWAFVLTSRVRSLLGRSRVDRELDIELEFHLAQEIEENVAAGMSRKDARAAAVRTRGSETYLKEVCRESLGLRVADELAQDIRYTTRSLVKNPAFTLIAVLTLALGIGANAALFTLLDAVIFKPLPVPRADELVTLYENGPEALADAAGGTGRYLRFSYPRYARLKQALGPHGLLAAVTRSSPFVVRVPGSPQAQVLQAQLVSGPYFSTLGVSVARGRLLTDDDVGQAAPVAVVSDTFWRRTLGADEAAVGRSITINGLSITIIGIAERGFVGMWSDSEASLWLPLTLQSALRYQNNSSTYGTAVNMNAPWPMEDRIAWLNLVGRVSPAELPAATALLLTSNQQGIADLAATMDPRDSMRRHTLIVERFSRGFSGLRARYSDALLVLTGLSATVLLVTCMNIANLLWVRMAGRARDIGIRLALGATTSRLLRQRLIESVMLGMGGGAIGLIVGEWASGLLARQVLNTSGDLPLVFSPDARVFAFTASVSFITAIVFGLAPTLRAMRMSRSRGLSHSQRQAIDGTSMSHVSPIVTGELALSVVVVFVALLLGRTLINFMQLDPGFAAEHLLTASFDPVQSGYPREKVAAVGQRLVATALTIPAITSAVVSRCGLIAGCRSSGGYRFEGIDKPRTSARNWVGPGYFSTVGIPLVSGREFDEQDTMRNPGVAIISESLARQAFPDHNAVGKRMGDRLDVEIVGVVRDARSYTLHEPPTPMIYFPIFATSDVGMLGLYFDARVTRDPKTVVSAFRDAVHRVEPSLTVNDISTGAVRVRRDTSREAIVAYLASSFAVLTSLLAALGLYGVLSSIVAQRTREIGVRIALGARRIEVIQLVLNQSIRMVVAGMVLGIIGTAATVRFLSGLLYGVTLYDPTIFLMIFLTFFFLAMGASYLPVRRAAKIDPLIALRCE